MKLILKINLFVLFLSGSVFAAGIGSSVTQCKELQSITYTVKDDVIAKGSSLETFYSQKTLVRFKKGIEISKGTFLYQKDLYERALLFITVLLGCESNKGLQILVRSSGDSLMKPSAKFTSKYYSDIDVIKTESSIEYISKSSDISFLIDLSNITKVDLLEGSFIDSQIKKYVRVNDDGLNLVKSN